MTVLTAATAQLDLSADGLVEVRGPAGEVLGCHRLVKSDPLDGRAGLDEDEFERRAAGPDPDSDSADEVAAKMRLWRVLRGRKGR